MAKCSGRRRRRDRVLRCFNALRDRIRVFRHAEAEAEQRGQAADAAVGTTALRAWACAAKAERRGRVALAKRAWECWTRSFHASCRITRWSKQRQLKRGILALRQSCQQPGTWRRSAQAQVWAQRQSLAKSLALWRAHMERNVSNETLAQKAAFEEGRLKVRTALVLWKTRTKNSHSNKERGLRVYRIIAGRKGFHKMHEHLSSCLQRREVVLTAEKARFNIQKLLALRRLHRTALAVRQRRQALVLGKRAFVGVRWGRFRAGCAAHTRRQATQAEGLELALSLRIQWKVGALLARWSAQADLGRKAFRLAAARDRQRVAKALWAWRAARATQRLRRAASQSLLPAVWARWVVRVEHWARKATVLGVATTHWQRKAGKRLLLGLVRRAENQRAARMGSLHHTTRAAWAVFVPLFGIARQGRLEKQGLRAWNARNAQRALVVLMHGAVLAQQKGGEAGAHHAAALQGKTLAAWRALARRRAGLRAAGAAVRHSRAAATTRRWWGAVRAVAARSRRIRTNVALAFLGSRRRLWSQALALWRAHALYAGRLQDFAWARAARERRRRLAGGLGALRAWAARRRAERGAARAAAAGRRRRALAAGVGAWRRRAARLAWVRAAGGAPHRWGARLTRQCLRAWRSHVRRVKTNIAIFQHQLAALPPSHLAHRAGPVLQNLGQGKGCRAFSFRSWRSYALHRRARGILLNRGATAFWRRKAAATFTHLRHLLSKRRCHQLCRQVWANRAGARALESFTTQLVLARRARVRAWVAGQHRRAALARRGLSAWAAAAAATAGVHGGAAGNGGSRRGRAGAGRGAAVRGGWTLRTALRALRRRALESGRQREALVAGEHRWRTGVLREGLDEWYSCMLTKRPYRRHQQVGIVRQRRRGLKWGFLALQSAASARQLRRVDAEALHQHYSNNLARRFLSNWNEHSRLSIDLRENIYQSLSEREIPHHPLRWVVTRLKKQLLVRTKHKRVRANGISIRHLARNGLRNMWQHMQEVQRARMEEERAFHHFSQKVVFPVFVKILVHARRRKRAKQKNELYLHAMDRHRMTKTLAQWHGNATVLAQEHRAQAFGDRRLMKRVWAGLTKYTEISTDIHIHEQAVVNFSASTRLVRSWKQWTLLFKVLRCAKTLQKKRTISRLSLRILQKKEYEQSIASARLTQLNTGRRRRALQCWARTVQSERAARRRAGRRALRAWRGLSARRQALRQAAERRGAKKDQMAVEVAWKVWYARRQAWTAKRRRLRSAAGHCRASAVRSVFRRLAVHSQHSKESTLLVLTMATFVEQGGCEKAFEGLRTSLLRSARAKENMQRAKSHHQGLLYDKASQLFPLLAVRCRGSQVKKVVIYKLAKKALYTWRLLFLGGKLCEALQKLVFRSKSCGFARWRSQARALGFLSKRRKHQLQEALCQIQKQATRQATLRHCQCTLKAHRDKVRARDTWALWVKERAIRKLVRRQRQKIGLHRLQEWVAEEQHNRRVSDKRERLVQAHTTLSMAAIEWAMEKAWNIWRRERLKQVRVDRFIRRRLALREELGLDMLEKRKVFDRLRTFAVWLPPDLEARASKVREARRRRVLRSWRLLPATRQGAVMALHAAFENSALGLRRGVLGEAFDLWRKVAKAAGFAGWYLQWRMMQRWAAWVKGRRQERAAAALYRGLLLQRTLFRWWSFAAARTHRRLDTSKVLLLGGAAMA